MNTFDYIYILFKQLFLSPFLNAHISFNTSISFRLKIRRSFAREKPIISLHKLLFPSTSRASIPRIPIMISNSFVSHIHDIIVIFLNIQKIIRFINRTQKRVIRNLKSRCFSVNLLLFLLHIDL